MFVMESTSQKRRGSFMMLLTVAHKLEGVFVLELYLWYESSEFYLWVRNHKDKIRLGLYIQVVENCINIFSKFIQVHSRVDCDLVQQ